jgi:NADPH2 dehydrogenase
LSVKCLEPFVLRELEIRNRIVMPPMCMYCATQGMASDFHLAHYGARALGGTGLIIVEATGVLPEGRITDRCLGFWDDRQIEPMRRIVDLGRSYGARVGIQLNHAGRKCTAGEVTTIFAPSPIRYDEESRVPEELTPEGIRRVVKAFAASAARAADVGFDLVEIHAAHGYLLNQFLSPVTNRRTDAYGGSTENRARLLVEVARAVRDALPARIPLQVRVSAVDHVPGGLDVAETCRLLHHVKTLVDCVHVSSGGLTPTPPKFFPGYQVPYSAEVRRTLGLPTIAVGLVTEPELIEEILLNERADMVAIGRGLLRNPFLPLDLAKRAGAPYTGPEQYRRAFM